MRASLVKFVFLGALLSSCQSGRGTTLTTSNAPDVTPPVPAKQSSPQVSLVPHPSPHASSVPQTASGLRRGLLNNGPWLVYYGQAQDLGDLATVAKNYRLFIVQAASFNAAQIAVLKAGGRNRVLNYLDIGSVDHSTSWWSSAPTGFVAASQAKSAQIGPYGGYPEETWMNPQSSDWRHLLIDYVAPKQLANGADGFFMDNLELLEHSATQSDGPCDTGCASAGFELVYALRAKFPNSLFVMNNATSAPVRTAITHGVPFSTLLDGIVHEGTFTAASQTNLASDAVYHVATDTDVVSQLDAWKNLEIEPGGQPLWIGTLDFVNSCKNTLDAKRVSDLARAHGFSPSIGDKSSGLQVVCEFQPGP